MDTKTIVITLAFVSALAAGYYVFAGQSSQPAVVPVNPLKDVYNQWKVEYGVHVGAAEDDTRFKIFEENYAKIQAVNSQNKSYKLGMNAFTHLTEEEFSATHLGFKPAALPNKTVKLPLKVLKQTIDWAPKMNPPKDQGQCGSCWAFSAVGAIEGAHSVLNKNLMNLAEQELVDCAGSFGNNGCSGGLMDNAFQYVISVGGLASQADYPYTAADGSCKSISTRQGKITSFVDVRANNSDALKAAVARQPVAVAIEADTYAFQGYTSGVISGDACGTQLDHGVVVVGYSDEGTEPYYKVRNSWGPRWGDAGHCKIAITDGAGTCGINQMASFPTV